MFYTNDNKSLIFGKMKTSTVILAGLAAIASAVPTNTQFREMWSLAKRQNELAAAAGLTDVDILQLYVVKSP